MNRFNVFCLCRNYILFLELREAMILYCRDFCLGGGEEKQVTMNVWGGNGSGRVTFIATTKLGKLASSK